MILLLGVGASHLKKSEPQWVELPPGAPLAFDPQWLKLATLGLWPAAVDGLWLKAMVDPSYAPVPTGTHAPTFYYLDLITQLDRGFFDAYVFGGNFISVVRHDSDGARHLLERANAYRKEELPRMNPLFREKYWSQEWAVPLILAYLHLFEFDDLTTAAIYFREAAEAPQSPAYLRRLVSRLGDQEKVMALGIRVLGFMEEVNRNYPQVVEDLRKRREMLSVHLFLFRLKTRFLDYLKGRGRGSLKNLWNEFLIRESVDPVDPAGGRITLDSGGKLSTTTALFPVLGFQFKGDLGP